MSGSSILEWTAGKTRNVAVGLIISSIALGYSPAASASPRTQEIFVQRYGQSVCADLVANGSGQRSFWTIHSYWLSELGMDLSYDELQFAMGTAVIRYCPRYWNDYEYYKSVYTW